MFISIIIPVYKVEKYIAECLRSCLEQNIGTSEYELILVDDGSPDKSIDIARQITDGLPNVTIISQQNAGLAAARNKGLSLAEGKYVWFVDSDDRIAENCLGFINSICENSEPDIISVCAADMVDAVEKRRFSRRELECRNGKSYIINGDIQVCTPFSIFRKDFLAENGLRFTEGIFHEDSEFTPRAYYFAEKVISTDRILYLVTINPDSITRSPNPKKATDSISVVQRNISEFALKADKDCLKGFNNLISSDFNHALKNSYRMSPGERIELTRLAYENRYLLKHLLGASVLKYRISGLVYSLFPKHIPACYRFLQKFKVGN